MKAHFFDQAGNFEETRWMGSPMSVYIKPKLRRFKINESPDIMCDEVIVPFEEIRYYHHRFRTGSGRELHFFIAED